MTAADGPADVRGTGPGLSAGSARSVLVTELGELGWPENRPVWTSALLYVLRGLGIEEQTARQAIARGAADTPGPVGHVRTRARRQHAAGLGQAVEAAHPALHARERGGHPLAQLR